MGLATRLEKIGELEQRLETHIALSESTNALAESTKERVDQSVAEIGDLRLMMARMEVNLQT